MGKRYSVNHNYFDIIDTENKAYWLGFLWCDGYVSKRLRKGKWFEFSIKLSTTHDVDHLEKFKKDIQSTHPIKTYKTTGYTENSVENRVMFNSPHMGYILQEKYGIIPNRYKFKHIVELIPKSLFRHFVRGCLDADGCISISGTTNRNRSKLNLYVNWTSYYELINEIEKFLTENKVCDDVVRKKYRRHEDGDAHCRTLSMGGIRRGVGVLNFLYEDASIYLDRKYNKYKEVVETIKEWDNAKNMEK